jgi:hypothetical protein
MKPKIRKNWGDLKPTPRIVNSKKIYVRKNKFKNEDYD